MMANGLPQGFRNIFKSKVIRSGCHQFSLGLKNIFQIDVVITEDLKVIGDQMTTFATRALDQDRSLGV